MKNITWRKIAMILSVVIAGVVAFGVGYSLGAMRVADFIVDKAVEINLFSDIGKAELMEYFLRLKGGGS